MNLKILSLVVILIGLFSLPGFCQTTEKSTHPLLDKYYPSKKKAESENIITNWPKAEAEPVVVAPAKTTQPVAETPTISKVPTAIVPPETKVASDAAPVQVATDSVAVIKPTNPIPAPVVQKKIVAKPQSTPYRDTRLGSSSNLYRTWETNNNGAGSVTTGSK